MIAGGGILAIVDGHAEVPLAEVGGGVAVFLEHLCDGRFALQKMHLVKSFGDDRVDAGATVLAACQKGGARGGSGSSSRVEIGEAHATGGQLVENGGLDGTAVAAEVAVSEVIDEEGDDIRRFVFGKTRTSQQQGA